MCLTLADLVTPPESLPKWLRKKRDALVGRMKARGSVKGQNQGTGIRNRASGKGQEEARGAGDDAGRERVRLGEGLPTAEHARDNAQRVLAGSEVDPRRRPVIEIVSSPDPSDRAHLVRDHHAMIRDGGRDGVALRSAAGGMLRPAAVARRAFDGSVRWHPSPGLVAHARLYPRPCVTAAGVPHDSACDQLHEMRQRIERESGRVGGITDGGGSVVERSHAALDRLPARQARQLIEGRLCEPGDAEVDAWIEARMRGLGIGDQGLGKGGRAG